jgi:hypothetical protein
MEEELITIEQARKKLGERGETMTDREIGNVLNTLRLLCDKTIDAVIEKDQIKS